MPIACLVTFGHDRAAEITAAKRSAIEWSIISGDPLNTYYTCHPYICVHDLNHFAL